VSWFASPDLLADAAVDPTTATGGGLTTSAHIFIFLMAAGAVVFILRLVRLRQLRGKYALLWSAVALLLGVLAVAPGVFNSFASFVGVYYPPALLLLLTTGFLFLVVIHFSWELSRLEERTRTLAEEVALLRARLDADEHPSGEHPSGEHPSGDNP
jgi:hypothetical protein